MRRLLLVVGLAVAVWSAVAIPVRATRGAQTTADEPQYLLSALSLWEDRDLDIGDEIDQQRYRDFHDATLPVQTEPLDGGRVVSPHDPGLPALLAVPVGLGGWVGAKLAMAALAGALAALLTWIAVARLGVARRTAAAVALGFGAVSPFVAYGTQIYPELPAALATAAAVGALLGPLRRVRAVCVVCVAIVVLPWLGVKYVAVAAALALILLWRLWRDEQREAAARAAGALALAGIAYVVAHRLLYDGWTSYNAGDHFSSEETVMGYSPDLLGRTRRLYALVLDRGFGIAAWAPGYLLAVPALAAFVRRRPVAVGPLLLPLAGGWLTATWLALTMHGWWWPGRQTVVVLPCLVLVVAWWVDRVRAALPVFVAAAAAGVAMWGWLVVEGIQERITLVVSFETTRDPLYRGWRGVLPDYHHPSSATWALTVAWGVALAALATWSWRRAALVDPPRLPSPDATAAIDPQENRRPVDVVA